METKHEMWHRHKVERKRENFVKLLCSIVLFGGVLVALTPFAIAVFAFFGLFGYSFPR